jgi:hypothetical protein
MFEKFKKLSSIKSYLFPMIDDGGGGGGGAAVEWKNPAFAEQFEESLRSNASLSQFEGTNDLGKAFVELGATNATLKGDLEGKVKIPDENSTDEERSAFFKALGRPDKSEEYVINRPEEMPPGMTYDEAFEKDFRTIVHDLGLNQKQSAGMAKMFMEYEVNRHKGLLADMKESREKAVETLKKDWPGDYYEKNGAQAKRAMLKFGEVAKIPDFQKWMDETGFGDVPEVIRLFHAAFGAIGDDYFIPASGGGTSDNDLAPGEIPVFKSYEGMKKK